MATLGELLTEDQLLHLEDLVNRRKITTDWIQDIFIPRLTHELGYLDWEETRVRAALGNTPPSETQERFFRHITERRSRAFETALNPDVFKRSMTQLEKAAKAIGTGEAGDRLADYLKEQGPIGVAKDVGKSLVESIPRGVAATAQTVKEGGFGEQPISRIGEMTGAIPVVGGGSGLLARQLARSAAKSAGKAAIRSVGGEATRKALRNVPAAAVKEALESGVGGGRASLAQTLSKVAEGTRIPGYIGEAADVAGGEENILIELGLEGLGEFGIEGARFAGRRAVDQLSPQEKRKVDNDAAAEALRYRVNKPKIDAALDADALLFAQLTHQIATRKTDPTPEEVANISDELFVATFENQIAPQIQGEIDALGELGLQNAGDVLRARMLELHQSTRPQQEGAIDATESTERDNRGTEPGQTETAPPESAPETPEQPATQTPEETQETPDETSQEKEEVALTEEELLDIEESAAASIIEAIAETGEADVDIESFVEQAFTQGVESGEITETTAQTLYPRVLARVQNALKREPTPEELEAQAEEEAAAIVANATRPNTYFIENALEGLSEPVDAETFLSMFGDDMPQAYRDNPRAMDMLLNLLVEDEASRVTATETDGVRQYTAEAAVDNIPEEQKGTVVTAHMSDGTPYKVRPVVRELYGIVQSHDIEGNEIPDYPPDLQPREGRTSLTSGDVTRENAHNLIPGLAVDFPHQFDKGPPLTSKRYPGRTVAGTGRRNMLQYVYENLPEKWQEYLDYMAQHLPSIGIDPAVLDNIEVPALHYELVENVDEIEIAKDTNIQTTLDTTGQEQAKHDAQSLFDVDVLALWESNAENLAPFASAISDPENESFRVALINRIPKNLRPDFLTQKEELSKKGIERLKDALMYYVFGDSETAQRLIDEGAIEDAPKIKLMLDYILVDLAYVKSRGLDISKELDTAIHRLIAFSKRADNAPDTEKRKFDKTERMWKEVNSYLTQQSLGGQDSPLERQILYLLYTRRGAEKQLAEHFQLWAAQAVDFLAQGDGLFGAADPAEQSAALFDIIIKTYLEAEAFQVDKDRADAANPWRTPSNLPPELRDIRREIDALTSPTEQTETFNAWVDNFLQHVRTLQGDTDATPETTETAPDAAVELGADTSVSPRTGRDVPQGSTPGEDTGATETPESASGVDTAQPGTPPVDEHRGTQGDADSVPADDRGESLGIEEALAIASVGTVSIDEWNAADPAGKRSFLQKQEQAIPVHLRNGVITAEEADRKREAIALLRQSITQETPDETTETDTMEADSDVSQRETAVDATEVSPTETETPQQPSSGAGIPTDTNQLVGVSRRQATETETTVSPVIQRHLDHLGITAEEWEAAKAADTAESLLQPHTQKTDMASIDAISDLSADIARSGTHAATAASDFDEDSDENIEDDDDFFGVSDIQPGRLRDITDQQRTDFETVRRKLFLAKTITRLEAKGQDRTLVETAQLSALKATQRTDAQQEIYEGLLTQFIDRQVARLQAKSDRSTTEDRILDALTAVQASGIPESASDRSLYADLDTPEQEHSSPLAETRTLAGVQAPDTTDTEVNLPDDVTADTSKLSPAQLTSVKAILAAFKRKIHTSTDTTVQGGFLLADKPGVGKTRQALAVIWHYMRSGIQKHFVLAPNPQLLNNYATDFEKMTGDPADISNYNSQNQKPKTPVATATYATLIRTPDLSGFNTTSGNQNAIADIVEHLTGIRPTFAQTHPAAHREAREAFARIGIHNVDGTTDKEIVDNAVEALRNQAKRVNLKNAQAVDQFRRRLTPPLAEILLDERTAGTQEELLGGSKLHRLVTDLLTFAQTHISAQPDPGFAAAAEAFEGVLVLDEMHKAAGTSSQTGQMIDTLTTLLPNAKFLYMSATPFKEIDNFYVASRLGLWGANQAFPTFTHFKRAFRRAVRAVKEIVPLHLKQIGRYVSRALSSKETKYTPVEIPLTDTEKQQYDTAVQLVQNIRIRFEASIDEVLRTAWGSTIENEGQFHQYRAKYMRGFYNATQKFFLAVLDSMKAQGLQDQIAQQLQNGDKIIVQLENTWDQTVENARRRGNTGTIGPFDLLIDFVENENLFPVHVHHTEVRKRSDGTDYTVVVPQLEYNAAGEQVRSIDPRLKRLQQLTFENLQNEMNRNVFSKGLPFAADIIHTAAIEAGLGLGASGEISGRSQIYPTDNPQAMPQDTESRIARTTAFSETTDLNLIVLGPAGLTGINLPVSAKIRDQIGNLYHYLVQSSWNVNTFEQGLGRGKRANSAIDPHYIIAHQDLPGADRVLGATLAKFAEMGALAGQADSALMQNVDKVEGETSLDDDPEADVDTDAVFEETEGEKGHIFGTHGQEALGQLWYDIYNAGDMTIPDTLGLPQPEIAGDTGFIDPATVPTVQQFFQRLLHQSTARQPELYQEFESRLRRIISHKKELGQLDTGANDLDAKDGQIQDRLTIYTDPDTGQTAEMVKLSVKRKLPRRSWEFLSKVIRQEPGYEQHGGDRFEGLYTDADGNIWAMFENPFRAAGGETEYVRWGPRGTPIAGLHKGENRVTATQLTEDFTPVAMEGEQRLLDINEAQRLWEAQDTDTETHVDSELYMATGMILPKWADFRTSRRDYPVMAVIPMVDGSNLHGRVISAAQVSTVLQQLGGVDPNHFDPSGRAEAPSLPESIEVDIPAIVREIVGEATDPQVRARLEGIVEHIHQKLPLRLRGHLVRSAQEAALLGQLIRDPQVEHVWIVYRREGRIVKIEPMSLNRKGEADAGDFQHIKAEAGRLHADAVLRIHNHPSGVAKWSQPDKNVAMQWHKNLGTLMAEDIIVDSGTFAYRTFENGKYTWHEDVALNPQAADWDTGVTSVKSDVGEQKATDPLYQNPLIRGAREAAAYMWGLKRDMNAAELVFVDTRSGKITETITDTQLRSASDPAAYLEMLLRPRDQSHVHIMMWGDDSVAQAIRGVEGVDSVWVGSQRITGKAHTRTAADQTITDTDNRSEDDKQTDALLEHVLVQTITDTEAPVSVDMKIEAPQAAHTVRSDQVKRGLEGFNERYKQEKRKRGSRWTPKQRVQEARISEDRTILVKLDKNDQWTPIVRTIDGKDYYVTPYTLKGSKWKIAEHIVNWRGGTKKGTYLSLLARGELQSTAEDLATGDIHRSRNAAGWDALTDNKNYIFLAPSDKSYRQINQGKALGFFFDAEWLIRNGATVGTKDSIEFYDRIIKNVLSKAFYPAHIGRRAMFTRGRVRREDILAYIRNDTAHLKGKDDKDMAAIQQAYQDIQKQLPKVSQQFRFTGDKALQLLRQGRAREILVPNRLSHDGLLGIIEDGKHFQLVEPTSVELKTPGVLKQITNRIKGIFSDVATEQKGDNILSEYQPSTETPYINRATRAMPTQDRLNLQGQGRSRRLISPESDLFTKLRLWTPQLRKQARMFSNAFRSGYGKLGELKAPLDAEKPAPGDIIEDMLDQRMHISQAWAGRTRSALTPVLKKLQQKVKREGGEHSNALRAQVDHDIINFIEYNTPLPDRSKNYQEIATEMKETWRKVNQSFVEAMIGLIRDLERRDEMITKVGVRGRQKWAPEPMGGMTWKWAAADGQGRFVDKQGTEYTIAEAFARTDQLWYPHQYDRSRLRDYNRKIEALVKALNEIIAQGDNASEDAFKAAGITKVDGGYKHNRLPTVFATLDAIVDFYINVRDRTATLLKYMEDGTIGLYPHLERVRETHDRLYRRDTNLLMSTAALLWDRFAEIATFGQVDPYGELPPRLATMLQSIDLYNANDREAALMAVINGLQELNRSEESLAEDDRHWGMHESIPAFERGERAAFDIMQMWEDYYIDDDGNKVKTGKWKGIDINRLELDGKTLETLQTIGFIQPDGQDGWKVYGKTDAAQQQTIARFFVELMQTKADRKKRIQGLVQSLGHWRPQKDPIQEGSDELWRRTNTLITMGALGWRQALQNLTEIPTMIMMAGVKSTVGLVKEMQDPEFRGAAEELALGLKQGVEFLADDNLQERYLNSAWSMFGWTERTSRMLGVGAGLIRAKSLSQALLASEEGSKNRARIEREMRALRMNPTVILEIPPGELDAIYTEAIARIKSADLALAGVELPSKTPAKHRLTDRIGEEWVRAAMYISDSVFKPYDARTLPDEFQKNNAFAKMFLKFKGWMFQQNRFIFDMYKRAGQEAIRHGNYRPLARILTSTMMLTGSVGAAQAVFAMLQGRDDNDDELLRAFLHAQTLGLGSVLWEMAVRSEGNPWRLEKTIEGTFVGPVFGVFADVLSPAATGDWDRSLQEVLQRTPVAREALYLGANQWWEDEE